MPIPARWADWVTPPSASADAISSSQAADCLSARQQGRAASSKAPISSPAATSEIKCTPSQTRARPVVSASNRASESARQRWVGQSQPSSAPQNSRAEAVWPLGMPKPCALWVASSGCRWKGRGQPIPSLLACTSKPSQSMANSNWRSRGHPSSGSSKGIRAS